MRSNWLTENRFNVSISCSSIEPEILEALVQLPKPFRVVSHGLTGVREGALSFFANACGDSHPIVLLA